MLIVEHLISIKGLGPVFLMTATTVQFHKPFPWWILENIILDVPIVILWIGLPRDDRSSKSHQSYKT